MSVELTPQEIIDYAFVISGAASPPLPAVGPDVSLEDQARRAIDWLIDSDYEDTHIHIAIGGAQSVDAHKKGFEVYIGLSRPPMNDEDDRTLFVGYELFDVTDAPDTAEGEVIVKIFKPGPWIDHLSTVGRRALPLLKSRTNDTDTL